MAIIKGIIAIIFMVVLVSGMVYFLKRSEYHFKKSETENGYEYIFYGGFCIVAVLILFIVFCIATVCLLSHL